MVTLEHLYNDIEKRSIKLLPYNTGRLQAVSMEMNGRYAIFLNFRGYPTTADMAAVLAHELGHCATGATHRVSSRHDLVVKHETTANRWALRRYLPFSELAAAVRGGCAEVWQLAEYFNLPESFIRLALDYYLDACGLSFSQNAAQGEPGAAAGGPAVPSGA